MPFLPRSLIVKCVFWVTSPLSWKTGMGNRRKTPVQGKMVNNLIHHLDMNTSFGLDGIHQRVLRELEEITHWASFHHYPQSWLTREVQLTRGWQKAHQLTGRVGRRVWRTTDLSAWLWGRGKSQIILRATMRHRQDNHDRAQPAGIWKRQVLLDQPDLLLWQGAGRLCREFWIDNCRVFNKTMCQVLHLDHNHPCLHYMLGKECLESCPVEKDQGMLLDRSWTCATVCPDGQGGQGHPGMCQE